MKFKKIEIDPDLEDIVEDFIKNTILDYNELKGYYKNSDFDGMRRICHRILGTAQSYGFMELDEIVLAIQSDIKNENMQELKTQMNILDIYVQFIKSEFEFE